MAMMLLTSAASIVLTCATFIVYEFVATRRETQDQIATLARIVAANSTATLAFRDQQSAEEVLATLKTEPHVIAAALYNETGEIFATYPADAAVEIFPRSISPDGFQFSAQSLEGFQTVSELRNRPLGALYIRSDMRAMYQRFWLYGAIAAVVTLASLLLAYVLSRIFQRQISLPILSLAHTARAVSERADFSVRAPVIGGAEFGVLTTAFNQMLGRIDTQNSALRESEERLRAVLDSSLNAVIVMDSNSLITDWNSRAEIIFGWSREEAIGRGLAETIIPPRDREAHRRGLARFLATGVGAIINRTVEMSALRRDGGEFPVELSISVLRRNDVATFCGFVTDITERRQSQRKLQTQLARLDLLQRTTRAIGERQDLESIYQVILRNLEDNLPIDFGCIGQFDAAAHSLSVASIGAGSAQWAEQLAVKVGSHLPVDQNGLARCVDGALVYEPDISDAAFPFARSLAAAGLYSFVAAPLVVENKVFGALLAARTGRHAFSSPDCEFLRQLSEHVALAAHQVQLYTQLQHAYEELRQSQQIILQQERLRALGQMASGVAHDINNAISPIALYTESLLEREPNLSERARDYLRIIQRAIDDVAQTVAKMREFYRQREQLSDPKSLELNPLIDQALKLTRARWSDVPQERGAVIDVRTELDASLPRIIGAESDIRDALTNLIFNAVDAMPGGGALTIRTRAVTTMPAIDGGSGEPAVELEVVDTGMGMDEDTRRRCLEPFFTTKGERGTGMGLAMVYGMVKRHGAQIEIQSAPGAGTTMRLRFLALSSEAGAQTHLPAAATALQPMRLLIIDDDPLVAQSLSRILEGDGHAVTTTDGGQAGIDAFTEANRSGARFDAVITDLGMPFVDGRAVAAAIKAQSPETPVLLLTGWGERLRAEQKVPLNVDRMLSKPPRLPELRRALAEFAGAGSSATGNTAPIV
ncbi:MAG: PAS domain S-box protein [Steroidobacter sp.]